MSDKTKWKTLGSGRDRERIRKQVKMSVESMLIITLGRKQRKRNMKKKI
jgi:hypothetical protein